MSEPVTEDTAPSNAELARRVDAQDSKLDMILDKISGATSQAHAAAQQHTEDRLDRPSTVAEEIRKQLADQRARDEADAEKRGQAERVASLEAKVTGMAEQAPEPITRRVEKIMGWR